MKFDKKYTPVAISLGVAAVLTCVLITFLAFSSGFGLPGSKAELKDGNVVIVKGKVTGYSNACMYDAQCGLTINDPYYGSVFVVTSAGLSGVTCSNQNGITKPLASYVGLNIEAKGKVDGERIVFPCSSEDYVRYIGDEN